MRRGVTSCPEHSGFSAPNACSTHPYCPACRKKQQWLSRRDPCKSRAEPTSPGPCRGWARPRRTPSPRRKRKALTHFADEIIPGPPESAMDPSPVPRPRATLLALTPSLGSPAGCDRAVWGRGTRRETRVGTRESDTRGWGPARGRRSREPLPRPLERGGRPPA